MQAHPTVTASTMIARFNFVRKVRCHNVPVDFFFIWNPRGMLPKPIKACNGLISTTETLSEFLISFGPYQLYHQTAALQ